MGITNYDNLKSHAMRGLFIPKLANDSGVNITELMAASRHKSASASPAYQTRSTTSECKSPFSTITNFGNKSENDDDSSYEKSSMPKKKKRKSAQDEPPCQKMSILELSDSGEEESTMVSPNNSKTIHSILR